MSPPCLPDDVVRLTRQEWVKLIHTHSWNIERGHVHMGPMGNSSLGNVCGVGSTIPRSLTISSLPSSLNTRT